MVAQVENKTKSTQQINLETLNKYQSLYEKTLNGLSLYKIKTKNKKVIRKQNN